MKYKKLGTTDLDVSLICLGTMTWGTQNSEKDAFEQMDYSVSKGVNFFDTAEIYSVPPTSESYGKTEEMIGNPLRELFKDEVRAIGSELGLPDEIVSRQPFPGPGLGIRIVGEVTKERLDLLRQADAIVREELSQAGKDAEIWQCPVVLLAEVDRLVFRAMAEATVTR